jgi:hypothetical protein
VARSQFLSLVGWQKDSLRRSRFNPMGRERRRVIAAIEHPCWVDEELAEQVAHLCGRCCEFHLSPLLVAQAGVEADMVEA